MSSATSPTTSPALPAAVRRGYGLGSVATGAFGTVPGLLLLPYLTDRIGITAALAGVIVFAPKAWDVVLNPVAGRVSDRSVHPDGKRRPFLIRAGLALAACFALLFLGPTSPQWAGAAWARARESHDHQRQPPPQNRQGQRNVGAGCESVA